MCFVLCVSLTGSTSSLVARVSMSSPNSLPILRIALYHHQYPFCTDLTINRFENWSKKTNLTNHKIHKSACALNRFRFLRWKPFAMKWRYSKRPNDSSRTMLSKLTAASSRNVPFVWEIYLSTEWSCMQEFNRLFKKNMIFSFISNIIFIYLRKNRLISIKEKIRNDQIQIVNNLTSGSQWYWNVIGIWQ